MKALNERDLSEFIENWMRNTGISMLSNSFCALWSDARNFEKSAKDMSDWMLKFKTKHEQTVTQGEVSFEKELRQALKFKFPDEIAIWGEELGDESDFKGKIIAAIDPIDGTSCMLASIAFPQNAKDYGFGVSIGWIKDGAFWGGHVFTLEGGKNGLSIKDIWSGFIGGKAYKNGQPIKAPENNSKDLYSTAPSVMFATDEDRRAFWALEKKAAKVIINQNCCGFMDAIEKGASAAEQDLSIHDVAAIVPILRAGAMCVTCFDGKELQLQNPNSSYSIHCAHCDVFKGQLSDIHQANEEPCKNSVLLKACKTLHAKKF